MALLVQVAKNEKERVEEKVTSDDYASPAEIAAEFREWLCLSCRKKDFICQQDAMREYFLPWNSLLHLRSARLSQYGWRKDFAPI